MRGVLQTVAASGRALAGSHLEQPLPIDAGAKHGEFGQLLLRRLHRLGRVDLGRAGDTPGGAAQEGHERLVAGGLEAERGVRVFREADRRARLL